MSNRNETNGEKKIGAHVEIFHVVGGDVYSLAEATATFVDDCHDYMGFRGSELRKVRKIIEREKLTEDYRFICRSREDGYYAVPACHAFMPGDDIEGTLALWHDEKGKRPSHFLVVKVVEWIYAKSGDDAPRGLELKRIGKPFYWSTY